MGIKYLNRIFNSNCNDTSIYKIHLQHFAGKRIAVDASIFLYRFLGEEKLIEQMYLMVTIFRNYGIIPIFVFDGVAPPEKKDVINERKENKRKAEERYVQMKTAVEQGGMDSDEKHEAEIEMEQLKKQFIHIKDADTYRVKTLLNSCGISWVVAQGEADEYCAHLMLTGQVYACLSEDMDLFAYGCCRILRHFSLVKHSVLMYDLVEILKQLGMNVREFRQILVLSGTDYNKDNSVCIFDLLKRFKAYKSAMILSEVDMTFYEWLMQNSDIVKSLDALKQTYNMFVMSDEPPGVQTTNRPIVDGVLKIENEDIARKSLVEMLGEEGFLFV